MAGNSGTAAARSGPASAGKGRPPADLTCPAGPQRRRKNRPAPARRHPSNPEWQLVTPAVTSGRGRPPVTVKPPR